jgi:hypothetical protein
VTALDRVAVRQIRTLPMADMKECLDALEGVGRRMDSIAQRRADAEWSLNALNLKRSSLDKRVNLLYKEMYEEIEKVKNKYLKGGSITVLIKELEDLRVRIQAAEKAEGGRRSDADDYDGYRVYVKLRSEGGRVELKEFRGKYSERDRLMQEAKAYMNGGIRAGKKAGLAAGVFVLPGAVRMYDYKGQTV